MALTWMIRPESPSDVSLLRSLRVLSVVLFLLPIAVSIWLARIRDPVPDFLSAMSRGLFERDGLCFTLMAEKDGDHARMTVYYQNRFDRLCIAKILIGPTRKAFTDLHGLPTFEFNFSCEGAEFGKQSLAWSVPLRFQSKKVLWDVAAKVRFPTGRGVLLRGRNGATVGDNLIGGGEEAAKAVAGLVFGAGTARPARVELTLPADIIPDQKQPSDLRGETIWKLGDPPDVQK
jgi:hypothetical protein